MAKRNRNNRFNFLTKRFSKKMQQKLVMLFMAIVLAFIVLIGRITYINASKGSKYTKIVLDQQEYDSRVIPYKRGDIVDRNGTKMASSERVYNVVLDVAALTSDKAYVQPTIKVLGDVFGIKEEDVKKVIEDAPDSRYQVLEKGVSYDKAQEFRKIEEDTENHPDVKGIWLEDDYKRQYPYDTLASDVIGFVSSGNQGAIGIESAYNDILSGVDGREYGYFDDASLAQRTVKPSKNGDTVVSSIDLALQSIVEQCIKEFNEEHAGEVRAGEPGSKNTAVIIMNPNTGEILTEASYPNFNLNDPADLSVMYSKEQVAAMSEDEKMDALNALWRNFAVSDAYEPGSTAKPFTVAAGLESGALTGNESYVCNGFLHVGDWDISCHLKTGHGTQTIEQAVANSCNVALMQMAKTIGTEDFVRYQHIFGFGEYTGIDLPGEAETSSLVYTNENMGITDLAINSFGQGFNVTMTQMAAAFSSLVNGGSYYEPHVVKQIQDESGGVVETKNPVLLRKTVSAETSKMLKQYMRAVMTSGTGKNAQVDGYDIGGKTGTAEKLPRNQGKYLLSFIGYAPQENPEVVVYVVIDEPNVESQDSSAYVLELSQKIMAQAFPYLNVTTMESGDAAGEGTDTADTVSQGTDYEAFDSGYEDTYTNQDGSYVDDNYKPDLDDWAAGQPSQ